MPEVSLLATLGFIAESLWDSRSLASIKIRVRCSEDGRSSFREGARIRIITAARTFYVAAPGDGRTPL